jgi:hypothetical protein
MARRPLAGFLVIVLGLSWLLFSIPVLALPHCSDGELWFPRPDFGQTVTGGARLD